MGTQPLPELLHLVICWAAFAYGKLLTSQLAIAVKEIKHEKDHNEYELRHEKTCFLHMRKQRRRSTAKLISAFVFAIRIVQSLYYLNKKIKPLSIFFGCTARFVSDLVGNPEYRFSHNEAHM